MRSLIEDRPRLTEIEIPADGLSLDLLRAVYRANHLPLVTRIRAAMACLKHEFPSLGVSINVNETEDFAQRLDRAIQRANGARLIEHQPSEVIEQSSKGNGLEPPIEQPAPSPAPLRRLYNVKHYRRL